MKQKKFLIELIEKNNINRIEELLSYQEFRDFFPKLEKEGTSIFIPIIEKDRIDILNIFFNKGMIENSNFKFVEFIIKNENLNEATKLKYLKLFSAYGKNIFINFEAKNPYKHSHQTHFNILEYSIRMDYLHITSWLLKNPQIKKAEINERFLFFVFKSKTNKIANAVINGKLFLKEKENIHSRDKDNGENLLMSFFAFFVRNSVKETAEFPSGTLRKKTQFLIDNHFDFNSIDNHGLNIIHHIVLAFDIYNDKPNAKGFPSQDIYDFIQFLKDNTNVNMKLKNHEGKTPAEKLRQINMKDKFKQRMILSFMEN